jgi:hypothetical protein
MPTTRPFFDTVRDFRRGQFLEECADKLPALPAGETIMFVTNDNNLVANDPRQGSFELKQVDTDKPTEYRNVAG